MIALLLARLCGVEEHLEISPLFETAEALEHRGERVVEEALRSPAWRDYLRKLGRLCLQFGYSDSGRYVGQVQASQLIERLKLRVADLLDRYGLGDLEVREAGHHASRMLLRPGEQRRAETGERGQRLVDRIAHP